LAALAAPTDDDRVLRNYLNEDGRLKTIPSVRKNLIVILKWLAEHFEVGRKYTEKEVNAVILQYHEDYATLRRELIGHQLMQREKGIYWRHDDE
jgi:hypothetical protein